MYVTGGFPTSPPATPKPEWIWVARDDGSAARRLVPGSGARISHNGREVLYSLYQSGHVRLMVVPAAGGHSRVVLDNWQDGVGVWSADSRTVAAVTGKELGTKRLIVIDVSSGRVMHTVATGRDFSNVGYAPDGTQLIYTRMPSAGPGSDIDITSVKTWRTYALTDDDHSFGAVWGPQWIVFSRWRAPARSNDAPKVDLYLVKSSRAGLHRLTHTHPGFLLSGLTATAWSASGSRLLAEFSGQDTSYACKVNPATGAVSRVGTPAQGLLGYGLSRDGRTILATTGGPDPDDSDVVAAPYSGGAMRILARHAHFPDWNAGMP
ncbi:MAG TPA: hypothetical protein VMU39_19575 [Solirubrobacteraceae bacterium]|nr:hypothetical protein [Solirubrobacteraceae bacterium]